MPGLGDTLTTWVGSDPTPVVTHRNAGETDDQLIDRHCRAVLERLNGGVGLLKSAEFGFSLEPQEGWTSVQLVQAYNAMLKAA